MEAVVVAATGPLLTAVLAALGFWLRRLLHERDLNARHQRAVSQSTAQITALQHWLTAYDAVADPGAHDEVGRQQVLADLEDARRDLHHAYAALRHSAVVSTGARRGESASRAARAVLLLDTPPVTWPARIVASCYYVSLAWLMVWIAAAMMFGVAAAVVEDPSASLVSRMGTSFAISVIALAVGLAPPFVLHLIYRAFTNHPVSADRQL